MTIDSVQGWMDGHEGKSDGKKRAKINEMITAINAGGGAAALDDLTDVTITSPADHEILAHSSGYWINKTLLEAGLPALGENNTFTGMQHINNTTDANLGDDNAALVIGTKGGVHIEIDNNEILAKTDTDTAGVLNLQVDGGSVRLGSTADLHLQKLTASALVETNASKYLVSVNKSDVYDKAFGTGSGQVTEGDDSRLHAHANKANLDVINQDLATSDRPSFDGLDPTTNNTYAIGSATKRFSSLYLGNNLLLKNAVGNNVLFRDLTDTSYLYLTANNIYCYELTASKIVETDGNKKLLSVDKGSAYNKAFAGTGSATTVSKSDHDHALNDISDVNAGSPNDDDALSWDSGTSKWIPQAVTSGASVAYVNSLTMVGSANSKFIPCAMQVESTDTRAMKYDVSDKHWQNVSGLDYTITCILPLATTRGSKKLYVKNVKMPVHQANDTNYVDTIQVLAMETDSDLAIINTDATDRKTKGVHESAFTAVDVSTYLAVMIKVVASVTSAGNLGTQPPLLECYYDT